MSKDGFRKKKHNACFVGFELRNICTGIYIISEKFKVKSELLLNALVLRQHSVTLSVMSEWNMDVRLEVD
jgi:hypothetical protein